MGSRVHLLLVVLFSIVVRDCQGFGNNFLNGVRSKTDTALHICTRPDQTKEEAPASSFSIRKCLYGDLPAVSDIIVDSFYNEKMSKSPFSGMLRVGELNRLQQNFPYNDQRHFMFVAISSSDDDNNKVIGFVDIDARPPTRRIDPPRPYLSDLAVHPDYRRRGIAKTLVKTCEEVVQNQFQDVMMYIRVERANDAAVQMYDKFKYTPQAHHIFGVEDTTVLLRKEFAQEPSEEEPALDFAV